MPVSDVTDTRGASTGNNKWSVDGVDITDMAATGASPIYYDFVMLEEMQVTTGGADVTIEATGAPVAVAQAMRYTRDAGRVCIVGQYTDHGSTSVNPHLDLNKKHLDVRGCWGSEFSHFYRATQLAAHRSEAWTRMKLISYGLERANEALADVSEGRVIKALIRP